MFEVVHEYPDLLRAGATSYRARAYGAAEDAGGWGGYIVFLPVGGGRVVATDRETTQSSTAALDKWARSISWVYLEGALERALARQPEIQLAKRLAEIERIEAEARAEAEALERAAGAARAEADAARREREEAARQLAASAAASAEGAAAFHEREAARARASAAELRGRPAGRSRRRRP